MKTHVIAILASALCFSTTSVHAGSATSSFRVTATVDPACTIQTTPLVFGHYNALTKHSATPLDVNGTVTITCSKGMVTRIALDPGQYAAQAIGTTRAMKRLSGEDYLNYELFQDIVRTTLWGSTGDTLFVPPVAPDTKPRTFFVFGRIPPGQTITVGDYADTIVAIVNF